MFGLYFFFIKVAISHGNVRIALHALQVEPACAKVHTSDERQNSLHFALMHNSPIELVNELLACWPEAALVKTKTQELTPLHVVMQQSSTDATIAAIQAIVAVCPTATAIKNVHGNTPLHHGLEHGAHVDSISALIRASPKELRMKNESGDTPLHLAVRCENPFETIAAVYGAWQVGSRFFFTLGITIIFVSLPPR